jgi:Amt family ammonium transporter
MNSLWCFRTCGLMLIVAVTLGLAGHLRAQEPEAPAATETAEAPAAETAEVPPNEVALEEAEKKEEFPPPSEGFNKELGPLSVALDTIWVLVAGCLVFFMQSGFTLVEAGLTRAKNVVNICMKNLLDFCFGSFTYWLIGFGLMFSLGNGFVGTSGFMLHEEWVQQVAEDGTSTQVSNFDPINWATVPLEMKFFFQLVFAATAATIVSGAMAERTKFVSYMIYSAVISALVYPISGHWIWGGGWLAEMGFWDFAGSTTVHSVGAWMALVGAFVIGPRTGKYDASGKARAIPGHNILIVTLGVFILWLGWFGFNPGSTMGADATSIAHIAVTTNAGAIAGALAALVTSKLMFKKWEATMTLNGVLAGLVSVTCPCAWISIPGALIIGAIGGVLVVLSVVFIDQKLKIDDPVGAISVHGVCGAWGTLSLGLFCTVEGGPELGLFYGGDATQLINQAIGVAAVFGWCLVTGAVVFYGLKYTIGLRVTPEEEAEGLDIGEHGNEGYHGFQFVSESA